MSIQHLPRWIIYRLDRRQKITYRDTDRRAHNGKWLAYHGIFSFNLEWAKSIAKAHVIRQLEDRSPPLNICDTEKGKLGEVQEEAMKKDSSLPSWTKKQEDIKFRVRPRNFEIKGRRAVVMHHI